MRPAAIASRMARCEPALRRWWLVPMHDAGLLAGRDDLAGVGAVQRQRLFAQHMLAGLGGGERLFEMQFVGGRDVDGVDVGAEQRVERREGRRNAVLLGIGRGALGAGAHDRRRPRRPAGCGSRRS